MLFILELKENNIKVSQYNNDNHSLETLKNKGEEYQVYDDNFWVWFKKKISYENELLSFVIISNKIEIIIPKDIKISQTNKIDNQEVYSLIYSKIKLDKAKFIPDYNIEVIDVEIEKPIEVKKGTITEYYINKTKEINFKE